MTRMTRKAVALAVALLSVGTVAAFAATNPPLIGVTKSAMNGVSRASDKHGALKANAVGNRQIKLGSVSCGKLSADLAAAICTGKPGAPGTPGAPGADGNRGSNGDSGHNGSNGDTGSTGSNGHDGNDALVAYGAAQVLVQRGTDSPSAWATYSTRLGSPVGDNTGGVFRFTCGTNAGNAAPCSISVKAAILSAHGNDYKVYPRVLVHSQSLAGGPETYCEYGDGSSGSGPMALSKQASTSNPNYTDVPLNIGGSADCSATPVAPIGNGDVAAIIVPAGYYDVQSTFVFAPA